MANTQTHYIACGDGYVRAELPGDARVVGGKKCKRAAFRGRV